MKLTQGDEALRTTMKDCKGLMIQQQIYGLSTAWTDLPTTIPVVSKPRVGMRQRHLCRILVERGMPTSWYLAPTVLCTLLLDLSFACPYRHFFTNCILNYLTNVHRCIWNFFTYLSWKNASIILDVAFPHVWKMLTYFTALILLDHEITGQNEMTPG